MVPSRASDDAADAPATMAKLREAVSAVVERARETIDDGPYDPEWASLADRSAAPDWFRDAKFGIYCHWGVYSVPAYNSEWYPRWMYMSDPSQSDQDWGNDIYPHHAATYGEPDEHPYQDFVPKFTAENFDPEAWASLFEAAGARFAGPVAEHHDGWSNWDSALNPWNAGDRGPNRDLVGELASAVRDRGMRLLVSFHHARTRWYYEFATENFPSITTGYPDKVLYGNVDEELFFDLWLAKLIEVIDVYEPDLIYHDGNLPTIPEAHRRQYLAYYFNHVVDTVVTAKNKEISTDVAVEDFERGRPAELLDRPWLTDTSLTTQGWCYTEGNDVRSARTILHELIDAVSKNGCLLLNVSPRVDGTIPEPQRTVLCEIGSWLDANGEAIYGTRPWRTFGEGPTRIEEGGHFLEEIEYTSRDVRYTRSRDGDTLYAIVMGCPERDSLTLSSLDAVDDSGATVELLSTNEPVSWTVVPDGLAVSVPDLGARSAEHAVVFALSGFGVA